MKNQITNNLLVTLLLLIFSVLLFADIPPRPEPARLVNDLANVLSSEQEKTLEYNLRYFHDTTSNQIVVLTIPSLDGYDPAAYAYEVGEKWQVGQKDFNNGIVILVKPNNGSEKGRVSIATGYGLEGAIPDAIVKRIIENEMIPHFREDDYFGGISSAAEVLMSLASGEITADGYNEEATGSSLFSIIPILIFILIFLLIRWSNARSYSLGKGTSLWTALWLGSALGGSHSGGWNNFSGGSSGFGGGGSGFGGGFSGFGGGSFGGGGASGSW